MGRWGQGIYESDLSLDFLDEIRDILLKEAAYVFSPEQIELHSSSEAYWLRDAITIIEMINVFVDSDTYQFGSPSFLSGYGDAVARWREAFFRVWDDVWNDDREWSPYCRYTYRVEQRQIITVLFDRLREYITDYWRDGVDMPESDSQSFSLLNNPQVFSMDGRNIGRFFYRLIQKLTHHIVFKFSDENSERGLDYADLEEVSAAIDLMGSLCETYRAAPGLRVATIQLWLDKTMSLWIKLNSRDSENPVDLQTLAEREGLRYTNVMNAFVRLLTVANQFPQWRAL